MDEFLRQMEGPTVLVKVGTGDDSREFRVPRDLLSKKAGWFHNALKDGRFREGKTGVISLPEDTPRAFCSFYYYLFHESLIFADINIDNGDIGQYTEQLASVIEAWIFADKYALSHMQDCATMGICLILDEATASDVTLPAACFAICFSSTTENSPLRKLVADYVVTRMDGGKADAGETVRQLATTPGFIQALHEAQEFHHNAKKDTRRRYQRPRHFADILRGQQDPPDNQSVIFCGSSWTGNMSTCSECGFDFHTDTPKCANSPCPDKKCCGTHTVMPLCWICASESPTYQQ